MVCSSYKKGSGHSFALHPSQIHVSQPASWCQSAVQLVSDFDFTPYVLRQRHGINVIPPPVTCGVILIMSRMSSMSFSTAPIPTWSLHRKYPSLFPPTGAHDVLTCLSQNNDKLYFLLHELIAFYEQASSRTTPWPKAFFVDLQVVNLVSQYHCRSVSNLHAHELTCAPYNL